MSLDKVYGAFIDYYGNISLKKIRSEEGYDVYAVKIKSYTIGQKYIFVVSKSTVNGSFTSLEEEITDLNSLNWISFQTRETEEIHNVPEITLIPTKDRTEKFSDIITCIDRNRESTNYTCESLPLKIALLHDPSKNNAYQFPDRCKIFQALETYKCVVEIL